MIHFGLKIQSKPSNHIDKKLYLSAKLEGLFDWSEEQCIKQRAKADMNFDLNMAYFNSLDFNEFNDYICKQCKKYKFIECLDLRELEYITGVYMLVLDGYKQAYIGISNNIKRRILSHWNHHKSLERLIFGDICNSILPIDAFGALDTTRIFYIKTEQTYKTEHKIVRSFISKYMLNRTGGGIGSYDTYTDDEQSAVLSVVANRKMRNLIPFVNAERLQNILSESEFKYYLKKYPELSKIAEETK